MAERVSSACYGTVLVLAALAVIDADEVSTGLSWELLSGVGVATWLAHLYAEVVGDHLRRSAPPPRHEIRRAMIDGLPILLAAVPPAVMLALGRLEVLDERTALSAAVGVAALQLVGVGAVVGAAVSPKGHFAWRYTITTAALGAAVVIVELTLRH